MSKLLELTDKYWDIARAEGVEGRDYDDENNIAQNTLIEIQLLVKELEEKAEAFDWFALHGSGYHMDYCPDLGWKLEHLVYTDQVFEGQTFLECVRKARGEE